MGIARVGLDAYMLYLGLLALQRFMHPHNAVNSQLGDLYLQ